MFFFHLWSVLTDWAEKTDRKPVSKQAVTDSGDVWDEGMEEIDVEFNLFVLKHVT